MQAAFTGIDALDRLQRFVQQHGSQREAAAALGITQAYLSDLVNRHRDINNAPKVLDGLGLQRAILEKTSERKKGR